MSAVQVPLIRLILTVPHVEGRFHSRRSSQAPHLVAGDAAPAPAVHDFRLCLFLN